MDMSILRHVQLHHVQEPTTLSEPPRDELPWNLHSSMVGRRFGVVMVAGYHVSRATWKVRH